MLTAAKSWVKCHQNDDPNKKLWGKCQQNDDTNINMSAVSTKG